VRRARRRVPVARGAAPSGPDVLVLGADDPARDWLCGLLLGFGFVVLQLSDSAEALARSAASHFVAIFVSASAEATDSDSGIDLCRRIRNATLRRGAGETVLVLVADQMQPADRVRADLVGCDDVILKPVTRGSVARLLDARGIALPSDARGT